MDDMASVSNSSNSSGSNLSELNSEEAKKYYGFVVFIGVIFLPAIIGNSHILHIYIYKKKHNNTRVYVCFIAVLDVINCVVCYPFNVVSCLYPFEFYSDISCRVFTYITYFVNICVPLSLLIISVDRFRVIYKPFAVQISKGLAKSLCVIAFISSLLISIPSSILYGSVPIDTGEDGIVGKECNLSSSYGAFPVLYIGVLSVMSVIEAIVLIVLYSLMGIALRRQQTLLKNCGMDNQYTGRINNDRSLHETRQEPFKDRRTKTLPRSFRPSCETEQDIKVFTMQRDHENISQNGIRTDNIHATIRRTSSTSTSNSTIASTSKNTSYTDSTNGSDTSIHVDSQDRLQSNSDNVIANDRILTLKNELNISSRPNRQFTNTPNRFNRISQMFRNKKQSLKKKQEREKESFKRTKRVTIMFFWITFVYIVSFLPNPCLRVVRFVSPDWYDDMNFAGQIVYHLVIGSIFLVSATNFFIYLFCDTMFRREIHRWYLNVFCRCRHEPGENQFGDSNCESQRE